MGREQVNLALKQLCAKNYLVFQKIELGLEVARHHKDWWDLLNSGEDVLALAPRDHGKSVTFSRGYPIWRAKYHSRWLKEIYILGADRDSAVENLDKIKDLMLSRPSLRYLVPETRSEGINSRSELHLMNGVKMRAKGVLSPLRGRHPQLIIGDDILNEKNSLTQESRDRVFRYLKEVVFPMKDQGTQKMRDEGFKSQIAFVGTAQHRDDAYHRMMTDGLVKSLKQKAIVDLEKAIVLWPERYNIKKLLELKEKYGSLTFSKEYQNEPISDDTSLFPPSLFEPLKDRSRSYVRMYTGNNPVFLGADFSIPGSTDGDWTVFFVAELDLATNTIIPLYYWRARPESFQDQIVQLEYMCDAYKVSAGNLEDNMFQRIYIQHIRKNTLLPLRGKTVTNAGKNSPETGLLSFRPLLENGKIKLPYRTETDRAMTDQLIQEFSGITQRKGKIGNESTNDDIPVAFWHLLEATRDASSFSYDIS